MDRRTEDPVVVNPVYQDISLTLPDGSQWPIPLSVIDSNNALFSCRSIAYGAEIGASIVMLAVILTMTPKTKFWRFTFLNIAALCNNIIRVILLSVYFQSSWATIYTLYSGDLTYVTRADVANTVASTVLSIPQNIMIMAALITQAWAMVKLWPAAYKWGIFSVSCVLVALEIGFMAATEAYQITYELPWESPEIMLSHLWVRYGFLALEVICICWFCFLFTINLVVHLYRNRSFLPQSKGLSAMDALVTTNGVLMLIPGTSCLSSLGGILLSPDAEQLILTHFATVMFATLQYASDARFEAGSMVYTSVIIVLPLGTLVAQRIADPAAFSNGDLSNGTTRVGHHVNDRFGRFMATGGSRSKHNNNNNNNSPNWSQSDKENAVVFSGAEARRGSSGMGIQGGGPGVTSVVTTGTPASAKFGHTMTTTYHGNIKTGEPMNAVDIELACIDADLEAGVVRVDHEIQQDEEVL